MRGVIHFLQAYEILGFFAEEASSRVELFCCTTMDARILPGRYKSCCGRNSIETYWNILRTVQTWHRRTFSCLKKWSILVVNASKMVITRRMLSVAAWYEEGIHKLVPRYDKCRRRLCGIVSKALCHNLYIQFMYYY